jgi:hypothetical protein
MAGTLAVVMVAPGAPVNVELSGSLPGYFPVSIFRDNLVDYLTMRGFRTITAEASSGYGVISHDFTARLTIASLAQMKAADMRGQVKSAAEDAGATQAVVSIPSIGEKAQPTIAPGAIDDLVGGLARVPGNLFSSINLVVIGLVVIVGLVAFGPNVKSIARRV